MEFDKGKVYTALNADELLVGSKCIFADTICILREQVQRKNYEDCIFLLRRIRGDDSTYRFDNGERWFSFVYLIEPPAEPKYKPFSSEEKAIGIIEQHECWIKSKMTQNCFLVGIKDSKHIPLIGYDCKEFFSLLLDGYVFADDGSPCGELVEDTK